MLGVTRAIYSLLLLMNNNALGTHTAGAAGRERLNAKVSIAVLSKIWQMMIKGLGELQVAPVQIDALEMILIRVAYSAT